jgi:hypothetical protein
VNQKTKPPPPYALAGRDVQGNGRRVAVDQAPRADFGKFTPGLDSPDGSSSIPKRSVEGSREAGCPFGVDWTSSDPARSEGAAHDDTVAPCGQLRKGVLRRAARDEQRNATYRVTDEAELPLVDATARPVARDEDRVGQTPLEEVLGLPGRIAVAEGGRMLHVHVGPDGDGFGAERPA